MIENLDTRQTADLGRFFLHFMSMELRGRLMAEQPVLYAQLFPEVDTSIIVAKVTGAIETNRNGGKSNE